MNFITKVLMPPRKTLSIEGKAKFIVEQAEKVPWEDGVRGLALLFL